MNTDNTTTIKTVKFGAEADDFLRVFYHGYGITSVAGKIKILEDKTGGPHNFYGQGGAVSDEMKLACLEYEFLELNNKIKLTLV